MVKGIFLHTLQLLFLVSAPCFSRAEAIKTDGRVQEEQNGEKSNFFGFGPFDLDSGSIEVYDFEGNAEDAEDSSPSPSTGSEPRSEVTAISGESSPYTFQTSPTDPPPAFTCKSEGKFADPFTCEKYHRCFELADQPGLFVDVLIPCPTGFRFCEKYQICFMYGFCECAAVTSNPLTSTSTAESEWETSPATSESDDDSTTERFNPTDPPPAFTCPGAGKFADPFTCERYHHCYELPDQPGLFVDVLSPCPQGFLFCQKYSICFKEGFCECHAEQPETSPPEESTSVAPTPPPPFQCAAPGYWPESDCVRYHFCSPFGTNFIDIKITCQPGKVFCGTQQKAGCYPEGSCDCGGPLYTTTTESLEITTPAAPKFQCQSPGYYPEIDADCSRYHYCSPLGSTFIDLTLTCAAGKYFCGTPQGGQCLDEGACVCGEDISLITTEETTKPTTTTTIGPKPPTFQCPAPGYYPDTEVECIRYHYCSPLGSNFIDITMSCPEGQMFCGNAQYGRCMDKGTCVCGQDYNPSTEATTTTTITTTTTAITTTTTPTARTTTTTTTQGTAITGRKTTTTESIGEVTGGSTEEVTGDGIDVGDESTTPKGAAPLVTASLTIIFVAFLSLCV